MKKQLIYDLPMRLFHWIFASLFIVAFLVAKTVDDESATFSYHMLAGFLLVFIVMLRAVWGFVGSRYARFSSFALHPKELISYFSAIFLGEKRIWIGHNPASSWASLAMMVLTFGLGPTGYLMANGQKETFEDIHELLANALLIVVLFHVAGVALHSLRHRDGIANSMLSGKKDNLLEADSISSSQPIEAILFVGLVTIMSLYLFQNFNRHNRTLSLFGTTLQLGENEEEDSDQNKSIESGDRHEDNDDD